MRHFRAFCIASVLVLLLASVPLAQSLDVYSIGASGGIGGGDAGIAMMVGEPMVLSSSQLNVGFLGIVQIAGQFASVEEPLVLPYKWEIGNAYPNPFNPSTTVVVSLAAAAPVHAEVYNVLGRRVAVLADGVRPAGVHRLQWRANGVASGVYFLRTVVPGRMQKMQRVVLIK